LSSSSISKKTKGAGPVDKVELWRSAVDSWKRLQRAAEKNLLRVDLSVAELRILRVLHEHGSSPMNRFSTATMLSQPTITGIVDKLEERRLVERVRSKEDRREVLIAVTPSGRVAFAKGEDLHRRFVERALSALEADEVASLQTLLKRLADASDSLMKDLEIAASKE
jgi:DNA-binding MarR family transcriptional regulator